MHTDCTNRFKTFLTINTHRVDNTISTVRKKLYIIPILSIFIIGAVSYSYLHSVSSNHNNYSLPDPPLYDKKTCFSPNDKLVDTNNNNWTHVFENVKDSVVKVAVSNSYMNSPEISTGFIYDNDGHISQVSHAAPLFPSDKQFGRCE